MSSAPRLSLTQMAVLSALMVEARELTNAELAELTGAGLVGEDHKRLVADGLAREDACEHTLLAAARDHHRHA